MQARCLKIGLNLHIFWPLYQQNIASVYGDPNEVLRYSKQFAKCTDLAATNY